MADAETNTAEAQAAIRAQKTAMKWIAELGVSEKAQAKWVQRSKKIIKRYKREGSDVENGTRKFALLWSNTETIRPSLYSRPPQPVVGRRFKDADPVGRVVSDILERGLSYSIDKQGFDSVLKDVTKDLVLIARGQAWERYVPSYGLEIVPEIEVVQITNSACYMDEEGQEHEEAEEREGKFYAKGEPFRPVIFEESITDYVNWEDFGCSPARTWDEVTYVWRRVYMGREQLIERFGEQVGKLVPLDWGPAKQSNGRSSDADDLTKKAAVYELWDKVSRKAYWISKSYNVRPLDEREDPLGLDGFFPCPRPVYGTTATDSLIPVPDFIFYQDQAEEIDELTARIGMLQQALKVKGFYAADTKTNLNQLFKSDTNILIPVPEWQSLKEDGGLRGKIEWMPIEQVSAALTACIALRAQLIQDVYQITGVSDIQRGASDPNETAAAQRLKSHWGSVRIRDKQNEIMRFSRDILRIKGEVIAEKFSTDTLKAMTGLQLPTNAEKQQLQMQIQQAQIVAQGQGQPPPPMPPGVQEILDGPTWEDVEALMRDNAMRQFRIDIETDSTIEPDDAEDQARAVAFLQAVAGFFAQVGPLVQAQPALGRMFGEMIKFAVRRFRAGRQLEDIIDSTIDGLLASTPAQEAAAAPEPPDTTPLAVAQVEQQTEQMVQQGETQRAVIAAQVKSREIGLRQGDQQLKSFALTNDPMPQGTA